MRELKSPLCIGLADSHKLQCSRGIEEGARGGWGWGSPLHMAPLEQLRWRLPKVAYLLFYCLKCTTAASQSWGNRTLTRDDAAPVPPSPEESAHLSNNHLGLPGILQCGVNGMQLHRLVHPHSAKDPYNGRGICAPLPSAFQNHAYACSCSCYFLLSSLMHTVHGTPFAAQSST